MGTHTHDWIEHIRATQKRIIAMASGKKSHHQKTPRKGKRPPIWVRLQRELSLSDEEIWQAKKCELHPVYLFRLNHKGKSVKAKIRNTFTTRYKKQIAVVDSFDLSRKYFNRIIVARIKPQGIVKHCENKNEAKEYIDTRFFAYMEENEPSKKG